jgi:putative transposase
LINDEFKLIIISSLQYLVSKNLATIYGYVIMPNHIHLLWYIKAQNGKESVAGSFAKYTAHQFKTLLRKQGQLELYVSDKEDRSYQFWKRDPLAIAISSEPILESKLSYIHNNPVKERWKLCKYPEEYRWSSARFYYDGIDEFGILTHYKE